MAVRCKVTFFDSVHEMRRSVEVLAESPARAAEMALARMLERHLLPTDFGPSVTVDVITSERHFFKLSEVESGLKSPGHRAKQPQAA
jgi:hypothetical protein